MKTILLVDDEDFFRDRLARAFSKREYTVYSAANYDEALAIIKEHKPMLAVVDLKMPGKNGLELTSEAQDIHPAMRIVILTGYGSIATATEAGRVGALNYLSKPADVDDILNAFSRDPSLTEKVEQSDLTAPTLAKVEWEHINRVLTDCDDNISAAAKRLGIHRRTLQRKLSKYAPPK